MDATGAPRRCPVCQREFVDRAICPVDQAPLLAPAPPADPLLGQLIKGTYRIDERLAAGGMGVVYRATQLPIERVVAVKVVDTNKRLSGDTLQRFQREAKLLSQVNHPNIVTLHDFGSTDDGLFYMVMEYLDGRTLQSAVPKDQGLPVEPIVALMEQIVAGVEAAHRLKVIHRDLKPSNIFLAEQGADSLAVKLLDFGVAKALDQLGPDLTREGAMVGTSGYMAPEQISGDLPADVRSDVYALGGVLHFMLGGRPGYRGSHLRAVLAKQLTGPPPPLDLKGLGKPEAAGLTAVITKAMAVDPAGRYQSALELLDALRAASARPFVARPALPSSPQINPAEPANVWESSVGALPQTHVVEEGPPQLPDYEILGELGRGGMGVVYKVRQKSLDRIVALKMIVGVVEATVVERFLGEARAVASLNHPGIVPIFEIGRADGQPYFTMTFVDGGTLSAHLKKHGPMAANRAAQVVVEVARAVAYAHQNKIIHRDLKPDNILLDRQGNPRVTDFGLAKQLGRNVELTAPGMVVGTPTYMAPEQARGQTKSIGPAVDVYALGGILYACLVGEPPFTGETQIDVMLKVTSEAPVPPGRRHPGVPADLEAICLKCLEKNPEDRYPTAAALAFDLAAWLSAPPGSRPKPAQAEAARNTPTKTFAVSCPNCGEQLPMAADLVGKAAKCPVCREHFVVPSGFGEAPLAARQGARFRQVSYWLVGCSLLAAVSFATATIAEGAATAVSDGIRIKMKQCLEELQENQLALAKIQAKVPLTRRAEELVKLMEQAKLEQEKARTSSSRLNGYIYLLDKNRTWFKFDDDPPYYLRYISIQRLAEIILLLAVVVQCILRSRFLYAAWRLVQDGKARMSPGMAVGGMFIPLFSLFWEFVAYRGLAVEFDRYIARHQLNAPRAPTAWLTAFWILDVVFVPLLFLNGLFGAYLVATTQDMTTARTLASGVQMGLLFLYGAVYLFAMNALARSAADIAEARFMTAAKG